MAGISFRNLHGLSEIKKSKKINKERKRSAWSIVSTHRTQTLEF